VGPLGPDFSFLYIAEAFDRMLELGVRPFVELSFTPARMASGQNTVFFYRANVTPPANLDHWAQLINAFTAFCVKRYGISEVSQWQFECWNEPNLRFFWSGSQEQYFELYGRTAKAVKAVDQRIRVGGPSTAQLAWLPAFIEYCASRDVPLDFLATHVYASDPQQNLFGKANAYPIQEVMSRGLAQCRDQIRASKRPDLPLLVTEWASQNPAFIAQTVRDCAGLADTMAYWTFSNVFEELGTITRFFNSTFGLIGQRGVARPSLHAFTLLHRLGDKQLSSTDGPVLATRRADGSRAVLVWNLPSRLAKQGGTSAAGTGQDATEADQECYGRHMGRRVEYRAAGVDGAWRTSSSRPGNPVRGLPRRPTGSPRRSSRSAENCRGDRMPRASI